jgi:hypothetical protein
MFASDDDRKKFLGAIQEISASMTRMEAERDLIREIVKDQSAEHQIPKKTISKIARTYHKQNLTEVEADHDEFVEIYEKVVK